MDVIFDKCITINSKNQNLFETFKHAVDNFSEMIEFIKKSIINSEITLESFSTTQDCNKKIKEFLVNIAKIDKLNKNISQKFKNSISNWIVQFPENKTPLAEICAEDSDIEIVHENVIDNNNEDSKIMDDSVINETLEEFENTAEISDNSERSKNRSINIIEDILFKSPVNSNNSEEGKVHSETTNICEISNNVQNFNNNEEEGSLNLPNENDKNKSQDNKLKKSDEKLKLECSVALDSLSISESSKPKKKQNNKSDQTNYNSDEEFYRFKN